MLALSPTPWRESYELAVRELDKPKLAARVQVAEVMIFLRGQELSRATDHREERAEMRAAIADLLVIKTYKLGWPTITNRVKKSALLRPVEYRASA